ncbi:MAG: hypothetical protein RIF46_01440 [Cyclobacteriaceae bacterium]
MTITDWVGSAGVFILLLAYVLVAVNSITAKSLAYILMNLFGALIAGIASYLLNYWPFIILEAAWVGVSCYSVFTYWKGDRG